MPRLTALRLVGRCCRNAFSIWAAEHHRPTESQRDSNPSAQGCEARATLGYLPRNVSTLQGLHHLRSWLQLLQSCFDFARSPSVGACARPPSRQRWAEGCNRVAVGSSRRFTAPSANPTGLQIHQPRVCIRAGQARSAYPGKPFPKFINSVAAVCERRIPQRHSQSAATGAPSFSNFFRRSQTAATINP